MKKNRTIALLLSIMLLAGAFVVPAFATDEGVGDVQLTQQEQTSAEAQEPAAIAKYGTYKGKNASKIPVITYHMFCAKKRTGKYKSLYVSKGTFDKQMKWLKKKGYRTINCEEFYLWYTGKIKLPKKTVLITFDDGSSTVVKYALPILKKYNMKGTSFIVGRNIYKNKKGAIKYKTMLKVQKEYPNLEFQSHTWALHKKFSKKGDYEKVLKDANKQKSVYNFDYLAYPYGRYTKGMIRAYKGAGIKLAFTYGKNGYATRKQNIYKIRRIKISGTESFAQFKRWFK